MEHQLNDLMAKTIANSMGKFEPDSEGSSEDFKNSEPINEKKKLAAKRTILIAMSRCFQQQTGAAKTKG